MYKKYSFADIFILVFLSTIASAELWGEYLKLANSLNLN